VTKSIALETTINGRPVRIGGIAKGSGMILHPNMATMLSFVTFGIERNKKETISSVGKR
jgi:glutamate N-acetyltransferase/amino-acid N-acetyltransferase